MTNNFGGPGYGGPGYNEQRAYMRSMLSRAKFIRAGVFAGAALVAVAFGWGVNLLNTMSSDSQADKKRDQEFVRLEPTEKYDELRTLGPPPGRSSTRRLSVRAASFLPPRRRRRKTCRTRFSSPEWITTTAPACTRFWRTSLRQ